MDFKNITLAFSAAVHICPGAAVKIFRNAVFHFPKDAGAEYACVFTEIIGCQQIRFSALLKCRCVFNIMDIIHLGLVAHCARPSMVLEVA